MDIQTEVTIDNISSAGMLSVLREKYIMYNGQKVVLEDNREALTPIDSQRAKEILPEDLYAYTQLLWTEEKKTAYKALLEEAAEQGL